MEAEQDTQPTRYTSCLSCGDIIAIPLTPVGGQSPQARCQPCRAEFEAPKRNHERDASYATASWRKLSQSLRREAACIDCGTRQNLSLDHLPGSHERQAAGLLLRPGIDVQVRCLSCNAKAGPTRPGHAHLRRAEQ